MMRRGGFTLMELLVVTVIIGLLAAIAIPSIERIRERGYRRHAMDVLMAIYTAERGYFAEQGQYLGPLGLPPDNWRPLGIDNPNDARFSPVQFTVVVNVLPPTFLATATRPPSDQLTIDQDRNVAGGWNP